MGFLFLNIEKREDTSVQWSRGARKWCGQDSLFAVISVIFNERTCLWCPLAWLLDARECPCKTFTWLWIAQGSRVWTQHSFSPEGNSVERHFAGHSRNLQLRFESELGMQSSIMAMLAAAVWMLSSGQRIRPWSRSDWRVTWHGKPRKVHQFTWYNCLCWMRANCLLNLLDINVDVWVFVRIENENAKKDEKEYSA